MSTIRNANTTGGGMYAPSQGINTALTNPNGITGAHQSNGAGFSGNAENFVTGNPFKPVPQGYTPYNPALGPTQQPLPVAPPPTAPNSAAPAVPGGPIGSSGPAGPIGASAPVLNPAPGAPGATGVFGEALPDDPNEAYAQLCSFGVPPAEAAKAAISGQAPPTMGGFRQSGGERPYALGNPPPGFYSSQGAQLPEHAGPIQGEAELGPYGFNGVPSQTGGPMGTISAGPPPGYGRPPQRGGQYDGTGGGPPPGWNGQTGFGPNPRQQTGGGLGPNLATGPSYQPTGPSPFDQYAAQMPPNPFGNNNFFGGGFGGGGRYGYGQGSNVSMLQALMGGGGGGYGDFLSQLLSRNSGR